jgi:predicted ferric reductase
MKHIIEGAFWIAVYLVFVLAPLFALLLGAAPGGMGFWWDLSLALGFAGAVMMMVQFVLTARFRRATAPYGIDIIYYFHRHLAVVGFFLVLLHPLLLFLFYPPMLAMLNPFEAPWHMTAGVVSVLALTALIVSSLWRKALRIHYDAWRRTHVVLSITAVGLAVAHIYKVGYYITEPWKSAVWTGILLSWVVILAYVRVLKPLLTMRTPYRVREVIAERGDAWTLVLDPDGHRGLPDFQPGQFVWMSLRRSPFALAEHPFSISSSPRTSGQVQLTIKELGDFSRTIKTVQPGERAYLDGPYGAFSFDRYPAAGYVFIAGGIGSAPMMSMLRALADRRDTRPHLLVLANSSWDRITFREAVEALKEKLSLRVVYCLEEPPEGWDGERGYVTADVLRRHLPAQRAELEYFVCGPEPMIALVEAALYQLGVPLSRFHTELFDLA